MAGRVGVRKRTRPRKRYSKRRVKQPIGFGKKIINKNPKYKYAWKQKVKSKNGRIYIKYGYNRPKKSKPRKKVRVKKATKKVKVKKTTKWKKIKSKLKSQLGKHYKQTNWYTQAKKKYKKSKKSKK